MAEPMSKEHKDKLMKNHVTLAAYLNIDVAFLACFAPQSVLSRENIDEIKVEFRTNPRNNIFLSMLPRKGERGYDRFIYALLETGQVELAEQVDPNHPRVREYIQAQRGDVHVAPRPFNILDPEIINDVLRLVESGSQPSVVQMSSTDALLRRNGSYVLEGQTHGRALVVCCGQEQRGESELLTSLFTGLRFAVRQWTAASSQKLLEELQQEAASISAQPSDGALQALVVYVLSSAGASVPSADSIGACFDGHACSALKHKPRLFFYQHVESVRHTTDGEREVGAGMADGGAGGDALDVDVTDGPATAVRGGPAVPIVHEKADQLIIWLNGEERVHGSDVLCVTSALVHSLAAHAHHCTLVELLDLVCRVIEEYRKQHSSTLPHPQRSAVQHQSTLNKAFYFLS